MIKIIINGIAGRMGRSVLSLALKDSDISVIKGIELSGHASVGSSIDGIDVVDDLGSCIELCDVVIDFTLPASALEKARITAEAGKALVVGTTGFSVSEKDRLLRTVKSIPSVISPNMSVGANMLYELVKNASRRLGGYDVEIIEAHHNKKKDSPSGTAKRIAELIANERSLDPKKSFVYGREGMVGERKAGEIGIHAVRAGDIVGEHTVYFVGKGERLELSHIVNSRDGLANGALVAAKWLISKPAGVYDMKDVLGL